MWNTCCVSIETGHWFLLPQNKSTHSFCANQHLAQLDITYFHSEVFYVQPYQPDHEVTKNLGNMGDLCNWVGTPSWLNLVPTQLLLAGTTVHKLGTPKCMVLLAKVNTLCRHCFFL